MSTSNVTIPNTIELNIGVAEFCVRGLNADIAILFENIEAKDGTSIRYSIGDIRSLTDNLLKVAERLANIFDMEDEA